MARWDKDGQEDATPEYIEREHCTRPNLQWPMTRGFRYIACIVTRLMIMTDMYSVYLTLIFIQGLKALVDLHDGR